MMSCPAPVSNRPSPTGDSGTRAAFRYALSCKHSADRVVADRPIRIRYVGHPDGEARLRGCLAGLADRNVDWDITDQLPAASLVPGEVDVLVVDLETTDITGLLAFLQSRGGIPEVPVVVLAKAEDEVVALGAVKEGAHDYVLKDRLDAPLFARSLRYALELHRLQSTVGNLSIDFTTGLYNRHSFLLLGEHYLRQAARSQGVVLLCAQLAGLRRINQQFGYPTGNRALFRAAQFLQKTYRNSDVIARVGGNLFGVLAMDVDPSQAALLAARLQEKVPNPRPGSTVWHRLAFHSGMAWSEPAADLSLVDLWGRALEALHKEKRNQRPLDSGAELDSPTANLEARSA